MVLDIDGTEFKYKDGAVTYFNMINNYVTHHFPVISMGLQTEIKIIRMIYNFLRDTKITLTIREDKLGEDEVLVGTDVFMKHTFAIVPMFEQPVYITSDQIYDNSKSKEEQGQEDLEGEVETMRTFQNFQMYLVDLEIINQFDKEYSDHLTDVSYAGALQKLFMARDIPPDKGFCTPPLLTDKLPDVSIPIGDLVENIIDLNTKYGLYDSVPIVYNDTEWFYCINKIKPDIEYEEPGDYGTVTFILLDPEKPHREIQGSHDDGERKVHWVNLQEDPVDFDHSIRDENSKLSTLTSVDGLGKVDTDNVDEENTRMRFIYSMNELTVDQVKNEMLHGPTIGVHMNNARIKFFRPYKDYTFEVDESYTGLNLHGHMYRILGLVLDIQRVGAVEYRTSEMVVLYRPQHDNEVE
ncbi:MAG: hypothetical protein K2F99_09440 [Muribaculaceae bacterium]|nr:hypothetical protein [Muribaculaceae bacterium]